MKVKNLNSKIENLVKKVGDAKGTLIIYEIVMTPTRYLLLIVNDQNKRIKNVFSSVDLQVVQEIGQKLSEQINLPFVFELSERKHLKKEHKTKDITNSQKKYKTDNSIFKSYKDEPFISLDFGAIFLKEDNFIVKQYSEKIHDKKLGDLINNNRVSSGTSICSNTLKLYSEELLNNLFKTITKYGTLEDKNSVRALLNLPPIFPSYDEKLNKIVLISN